MAKTQSTDEFGIDAEDLEDAMAGVKAKSTDQLVKESIQADAIIQAKINKVRVGLANEPKTKVRISPAYKPYLGSRCQIFINGVPIVVPCDGSMVEIPESYAAELYRRMAGIDAMIDKQVKMANYQGNREQVIGEIKF